MKPHKKITFIHRRDEWNCGDLYSGPYLYFPFAEFEVREITTINKENLDPKSLLIVGGGGLGKSFFKPYLREIDMVYNKKIAWGVGVNGIDNKSLINVKLPKSMIYQDYFDGYDVVGLRDKDTKPGATWVPCASCLHPLLTLYRDRRPKHTIGIFYHKDVPLQLTGENVPRMNNHIRSFERIIDYLSSFEYLITNTYHGAYWATLLARKVVVVPTKSSLLSFAHRPSYCQISNLNFALENAKSYPDALEQCKRANFLFFEHINSTFNIL